MFIVNNKFEYIYFCFVFFLDTGKQEQGFVSIHNVCGDLNKGYIPRNPMKQNIAGSSYPLYVYFLNIYINKNV